MRKKSRSFILPPGCARFAQQLAIACLFAITWSLFGSLVSIDQSEYLVQKGKYDQLSVQEMSDLKRALPSSPWSRQAQANTKEMKALREKLGTRKMQDLYALCGRTLYHGIKNIVVDHGIGRYTFFSTGDLPLMWIRDSAFQIGVLIPKMQRRPALRGLVEGGIRLQAYYILQDPYANGYYPEWRDPDKENDLDKSLGRGGWVGVRNYELDSGCFYISLLWDFYRSEQYGVEFLLQEPLIFDAVRTLVDTWIVEQNHNQSSPYRFVELANDGLGGEVAYTGMIWSGFRPSDDANMYGYSIPSNIFAASSLQKALVLNKIIWRNVDLERKMKRLLLDVETGIQQYGIIEVEKGVKIYAYEVDGLGHSLQDFDDPNWPSLISIPLLGWNKYDPTIYQNTRSRIFSDKNRYYFSGKHIRGLGSPHTGAGMVWALGTFSEALTAESIESKADLIDMLLTLQCGDGLMHESIHVDDINRCTRRWFEWANSLLVTSAEHLTGIDCDAAASDHHAEYIAHSEKQKKRYSNVPVDELKAVARVRQGIEAYVQHGGKYSAKVESWKGIGWTI